MVERAPAENPGAGAARPERVALRPHQRRVVADFWSWWLQAGEGGGWGRIVLPPRSGKTVVAAWILASLPVPAVFVVPTRTLVDQTARELKRWLRRPVGVYSGERKEVVESGVNVTTYQMLQSAWQRQSWPAPVAQARLVLLDEAHHAMSPARHELVAQGFSPGAARVALTATPDYDEARTLCRFFPDLVHEITIEEALDEGLLAPLRLWVAEVDAKGSEVRIVQGDYDGEALGRVMSTAPFARAVAILRYGGGNAGVPALLACVSRQQATDLAAYLDRHRPVSSLPPRLLLGDTPRSERERILTGFEEGRVDTIVQVGVLLEGWNSPRCKLLVDLAPSLSVVRSTQKYFRVMTRHGDREARIYVLLPSDLPDWPVLPTELFGSSLRDYECGTPVRPPNSGSDGAALREAMPTVHGVRLVGRIVHRARLQEPLLGRAEREGALRVLGSCREFCAFQPPGTRQFLRLRFHHELFVGSGYQLLRWLHHPPTRKGYARFLHWVLGSTKPRRTVEEDAPCHLDAQHLLAAIASGLGTSADLAAGWRALGGCDDDELDAESILLRREEVAIVAPALRLVPTRRRRILCQAFGLLGQRERLASEIAELELVSCSAVRAQLDKALRKLKWGRAVPLRAEDAPPLTRESWRARTRRSLADAECASGPGAAVPALFPPHRRRRRESERDPFERWGALPCPMAESLLIDFCNRLLEALDMPGHFAPLVPAELDRAPRELRRDASDSVKFGRWRAGETELWLERTDYGWLDPAGREVTATELAAEVGPLAGGVYLSLLGRQGHFEAFRVVGASKSRRDRVARGWLEVVQGLH